MKNITGALDLKHKKSLRFGLLLLSTLSIMSASILVYARMIYEQALNVGNTNGGSTGSGSIISGGGSFPPAVIAVLVFSAFIVSVSVFVFLREASKHISKAPDGQGSSSADPMSMLPSKEELEELFLKRKQGEGQESSS